MKSVLKFISMLFLGILLVSVSHGVIAWGGNKTPVSSALLDFGSPFGFHPAGVVNPNYADSGYRDAQAIGVKWNRSPGYAFWSVVQPDLSKQEYDFTLYDDQYGSVPAGIAILANIAPAPEYSPHPYTEPNSYFPVDESKYVACVKATVERYDGDGIDDMPGLANPIKYWQVGNEPSELIAADFAKVQRITYTAIKEACPDCKVLIGGVAGMPPVDKYLADFDQYYKPILDALGGQYVDIMDFHWYGDATGDYRDAKTVYDHIRAVLDADGFSSIPIWITEMGSYSGDPVPIPKIPTDYPLQTERQHALDYLKRFVYPLSFGVKKIFPAVGLLEGFKYDGGYADFTGLIYDGWGTDDPGLGVKKLGYYTYKKMTEVFEGSDWNSIQTIQASDNVYIYRFVKNGTPIYVAWWDYFADPAYTPGDRKGAVIKGLQCDAVKVTVAVPRFSTGQEVTDYETAFNQYLHTVLLGSITLSLGDSPVYVEVRCINSP